MSLDFEPVVVIGAGRSGTKILRDTLSSLPGAGTWPCDEINYVWRHGNARHPDDELSRAHATPRVRRYIRAQFAHLARRRGLETVVEKTCANSLRVGFVDEVLPEAKLVFLVRDGRDVVASALRRWRAPLDMPYLLRKARFVPPSDIPYYGWRYLLNRVHRLASSEGRLASWGPRCKGMDEWLRTDSLPVVCARQWRRCVERAEEELSALPLEKVLRLRYEDLVASPRPETDRLARFLGIDVSPDLLRTAVGPIHASSVGAWRARLAADEQAAIRSVLADPLRRLGYEPA